MIKMNERERLQSLISKAFDEYSKTNKAQFKSSFITDYLLENGVMVLPCKIGDEIWVVERDEDGIADCVSGYVFLSKTNGAIIASSYINDYDLKGMIAFHIRETAENYDTDLAAFPEEDCFLTKEEAEQALEKESESNG